MFLDQNGIIKSASEPAKNRRKYWYDTTNNKMYMLNEQGVYEEMTTFKVLRERIEKLESKSLLWSGSAKKGDTIKLKQSFKDFNFLHLVNGMSDRNFYGSAVTSTINTNTEIYFSRSFAGTNGVTQIVVTALKVINDTELKVLWSSYQELSASGGGNSVDSTHEIYVRELYGTN